MMAGPFRENCRFGLILFRYYSRETFIDISCLILFPITSTQGALKASRGNLSKAGGEKVEVAKVGNYV